MKITGKTFGEKLSSLDRYSIDQLKQMGVGETEAKGLAAYRGRPGEYGQNVEVVQAARVWREKDEFAGQVRMADQNELEVNLRNLRTTQRREGIRKLDSEEAIAEEWLLEGRARADEKVGEFLAWFPEQVLRGWKKLVGAEAFNVETGAGEAADAAWFQPMLDAAAAQKEAAEAQKRSVETAPTLGRPDVDR